jgi:hypothetical protein
MKAITLNKDYFGAALLVGLGAAIVAAAFGYDLGDLTEMGAGFLPAVLGSLMTLVGMMVALTSRKTQPTSPSSEEHHGPVGMPDLRGALAILGGIIAFVLLGDHGGMIPATFASVFIAASGDREHSWKSAALFAAGVTVFGVIVFYFGLKVKMPLVAWE